MNLNRFVCYSGASESSDAAFDARAVPFKRVRNGAARRNPVDKKDAPWQRMLDGCSKGSNTINDEQSRDGKYFRRRFRMPHSLFMTLVDVVLAEQWFPKYGPEGQGPKDCTGNHGASLHVKLLSVFRVLGRGVVFDECFDGSGCGEESIRTFFHLFTAKFAQRYYAQVVQPPTSHAEILEHVRIYQSLGMGAAVGSTDCTHIELGNCPTKFKVVCTGKSGRPTLSYSLTCSHARKIYHCTAGFFGSKNDKHISKLDSCISAIASEDIYRNFAWTLDVRDDTTVEEKGVFLICDGGYHKWPHMICGLKVVRRILRCFLSDILHSPAAHF